MATKYRSSSGCVDIVHRFSNGSVVERGAGYNHTGQTAVMVEDTGNGLIARFCPMTSVEQPYYVCLDYSQARDLVLALSPFARDLGFDA